MAVSDVAVFLSTSTLRDSACCFLDSHQNPVPITSLHEHHTQVHICMYTLMYLLRMYSR